MAYADSRSARALMDMRLAEARREAELGKMLREAGLLPRGWADRQFCRLAGRLGHLLVVVGGWLQHLGSTQAPSLKSQTSGSH
jgi:hypothetical protein